jgi:hypothetical protein
MGAELLAEAGNRARTAFDVSEGTARGGAVGTALAGCRFDARR